MADLVFCALCHKAVTDQDSNQLSLQDVLEQINVETTEKVVGVALLPIPAQFATFWTRSRLEEREKIHARLKLIAPDNAQLANSPFEVDLETKRNYRVVMKLHSLPISGSGRYWFVVESEDADGTWSKRGRFPLDITISAKPGTPDPVPQQ